MSVVGTLTTALIDVTTLLVATSASVMMDTLWILTNTIAAVIPFLFVYTCAFIYFYTSYAKLYSFGHRDANCDLLHRY